MSESTPTSATIIHWVVYEHPTDHPDGYVVRQWHLGAGEAQPGDATRHATLAEAHGALPEGVTQISGPDAQDPTIIETWM
jgi:hypothetical protein